jgi:hypothetical protein
MGDEVGFHQQGAAATAALDETWTSTAEVGRSLDPAEWELPTPCPGWSVKDQFSHLIGIERSLLGEGAPVWDGPLGPSPSGDLPYADFMDLRVFDCWVHEQDVRTATARPGGSGGRASAISLGRVEWAMGFVVGKKAAAPEGSVVRFTITGPPGDARQITLGVRGGRAKPVDDDEEPAVTLTLSSIDFVQLGCGRTTAAEVGVAGRIGVSGDRALADAVLNCMNFMF